MYRNDYTYDDVGNRQTNHITSTASNTNRTEIYGYDNLYRLNHVAYGDGQMQDYTFDKMGNRLTKLDNQTGNETYTYDTANRLRTRQIGIGSAQIYIPDANGNTIDDGIRHNTWDTQNQLIKCTYNGVDTQFIYGIDGLRRTKLVGNTPATAVKTDYILDNGMLVRERGYNGGTAHNLTTYLCGIRGPEYRRDDTQNDTSGHSTHVRWYIYDGLGSVVGEVAPDGSLTTARQIDVYGLERSVWVHTNPPSQQPEKPSSHKFVGSLGHTTDAETGGLVYMRARYMDTATGRFISEDSRRDGVNWFVYCQNNPVSNIDANGRQRMPLDNSLAYILGISLALASVSFLWFEQTEAAIRCAQLSVLAIAYSQQGMTSMAYGKIDWMTAALIGFMTEAAQRGMEAQPAAGIAVAACFVYAVVVLGFIEACNSDL